MLRDDSPEGKGKRATGPGVSVVDVDRYDVAGLSVHLDRCPPFELLLTVSRRDPERDPPNGPWRKAFFAKFGIELLGHKVDLGTSDTNRLVPRY